MGSSNGEGQVKGVAYLGRMFHLVKRRESLDETKGLVMDEDWRWEKGWGSDRRVIFHLLNTTKIWVETYHMCLILLNEGRHRGQNI